MAVTVSRSLPAEANFVELVRPDSGEIETGLNGISGEAAVVLQAAEALLSDGEKKLAIADDARRRIMRPGIVEAQGDHLFGITLTDSRRSPPVLIAENASAALPV